ncbi:MAG TPA: hypothetical protein VHZ64_14000, partial [Xanthobacteraceae bacterium]|nr:hypothetical protein [Xanthobacteraceae bacterium]
MRRRDFVTLLSGTAARPLSALLSGTVAGFSPPTLAQQQLPVIGVLSSRSRATDALLLAVIRQGLNDTGFVEGRNVQRIRSAVGWSLVCI